MLPRSRREHRSSRRSADELPVTLVYRPQRPGVLLLVSQSAPPPRTPALHPARRQYRVHPHAGPPRRGWLGPRVPGRGLRAGGAAECPRCAHCRVLRTRAGDPGGVPADAARVRPAADTLEPGLSPDVLQGVLATAAAPAARARRLYPDDAVRDGNRVAVHPGGDRDGRDPEGAGPDHPGLLPAAAPYAVHAPC